MSYHGPNKGGSFTGAGFGNADQVTTRQGSWNGLLLDWCGLRKLHVINLPHENFIESQLFESLYGPDRVVTGNANIQFPPQLNYLSTRRKRNRMTV
jgi:hypothetical protein